LRPIPFVRQATFFAVLILVGAIVAGCGSGRPADTVETVEREPVAPREVWVTLDGALSPANAVVEVALNKRFFAEAGLTVVANAPLAPNRPAKYVSSATDQLGLTQQPQLLIAKEHGAPLVAVGSLVSQPTAAMIWLGKSGIRGIADLKGKTIAVPGIPYQEELLARVLSRAGLGIEDVEIEHEPYELVPALLQGKADAIFGGSWNIEGVALRKRGAHPVIRPVQELGIPSYDEVMVIARADWAATEAKTVRAFMAALARAAAAMAEDPDIAVRAIKEQTSLTGHRELEAQTRATIPLLSPNGHIDLGQADDLASWMQEQGMIRAGPSYSEAFTNEYLSGEEP
jgi:putative hydroxymethylpyrimidine transport system substrate-binding protein